MQSRLLNDEQHLVQPFESLKVPNEQKPRLGQEQLPMLSFDEVQHILQLLESK